MLDTLIGRIARILVRAGVLVEQPEQPFLDLSFDPPLEQLSAAAVRCLIAVGPQAELSTKLAQVQMARSAER